MGKREDEVRKQLDAGLEVSVSLVRGVRLVVTKETWRQGEWILPVTPRWGLWGEVFWLGKSRAR